ncbi:MAG: TonB-dependent receptor [Treponema sp.]|nr:TonB-dependent receptor [Treponema sp.]
MTNYKKVIAPATCMMLSLGLFAQEANSEDVIVVTAAKIQQSAEDTVEKVTILSEEDIEKSGAHTLNDVINSIPGISYIGRSVGSAEPLQMNGFTDEYVKIMIDGVAVSRSGNANILEQMQLDNIDHIEVLSGSSSALYGSDAIAGVINIITKKKRDKKWSFNAKQEFESNGSISGEAGASFNSDSGIFAQASVGYFHADGDYDWDSYVPANTSAEASGSGSTSENQTAYRYKNYTDPMESDYSGHATIGYKADEGKEVSITGNLSTTESESYKSTSAGSYDHRETVQGSAIAKYDWALNESHALSGFFSFGHYGVPTETAPFDGTSEVTESESKYRDYEWELQYKNSIFNNNQILVGLNTIYSTYDADNDDSHKSLFAALFAQDIITLGKLQLIPGARLNAVFPVDDSDGAEDEELNVNVTPKLAARYDVNDNFLIRASAGMGYRVPTFTQKYSTFYKGHGDPNLKPETSYSANIGFDIKPYDGLKLSVNGFGTYVNDMIQRVQYSTPKGVGNPYGNYNFYRQYENLDKVISSGMNAQIDYQNNDWKVSLAYNLLYFRQWSDDEDDWVKVSGKIPHQIKLSTTYTVPMSKTALNLNGYWYAPRPTYDATGSETSKTADYLIVNFRVDQPIPQTHATVYASVNDIFNSYSFVDSSEDKSMKDSYTGVRRSFTIGAKYSY